jgi:ABC-type uncharacterized transport system auxiliary subunit
MIGATCDLAMRSEKNVRAREERGDISVFSLASLLLAVIAAGVVNGCGAARPSKYYQLTVPNEMVAAPAGSSAPVKLLVGNLQTSHLYREDRIVYSSGGGQMGTYEYQRWTEPATEMVEEVLVRQLRASGRYSSVYTHRSNTGGDFLLRGRLYDFKEVTGNPIVARVNFELEMRDLKSGMMVWMHNYTHDEPVSGKDISSVVAALDRNVQRGVNEMVGSLGEYFATHPAK